jgi:ubiquinone/menaquinone biosynthesis C-methylase UbiE
MARFSYQSRRTAVSELLLNASEAAYFVLEQGHEPLRWETRRQLLAAAWKLWGTDWDEARSGVYPRSLIEEELEQKSWRVMAQWLSDFPAYWRRRLRRRYHDLPASADPALYPAYYLRNFHGQTDGWFSRKSAAIWDFQVDLFFAGTTSAMLRRSIRHLRPALDGRARPRVMDLGCGTGRFLLQLSKAFPGAELVAFDLSPDYLAHARRLLEPVAQASFLLGNAEDIPLNHSGLDAVTAVGVLHELPHGARNRALREVNRVLRSGGVFIVTDVPQFRDASGLDDVFRRLYERSHEPFLRGYLAGHLEAQLLDSGFEVVAQEQHFLLKTLVARKVAASKEIEPSPPPGFP